MIIDYLLSAAATTGRQSFRRRQLQSPKCQQIKINEKCCILRNLYNLFDQLFGRCRRICFLYTLLTAGLLEAMTSN